MKKESEKVGLKLNIQKTKIMASGLITSWQIDGGNSGNSERLFLHREWKIELKFSEKSFLFSLIA